MQSREPNARDRDSLEGQALQALEKGMTEVLRIVRFSQVEEWLAELEKQLLQLEPPYVRVAALVQIDTKYPVLQSVSLRAGFWTRQEFVELDVFCGQRMDGDASEASNRYEAQRNKIDARCRKLGVEVRAGCYQPKA